MQSRGGLHAKRIHVPGSDGLGGIRADGHRRGGEYAGAGQTEARGAHGFAAQIYIYRRVSLGTLAAADIHRQVGGVRRIVVTQSDIVRLPADFTE